MLMTVKNGGVIKIIKIKLEALNKQLKTEIFLNLVYNSTVAIYALSIIAPVIA